MPGVKHANCPVGVGSISYSSVTYSTASIMDSKFSTRCELFMLICCEVSKSTYLVFSASLLSCTCQDALEIYILHFSFCLSLLKFYFFIVYFCFLNFFFYFPILWLSIAACFSLFYHPALSVYLFSFIFLLSFIYSLFFLSVFPLIVFIGLR